MRKLLKRSIPYDDVREAAYQLCVDTLFHLREDIYAAFERALACEEEPGLHYLELLLENADLASEGQIPLVQDAGLPHFFVEMGHEAWIEGGALTEALREGLLQFVQSHPFRIPILNDPLNLEVKKTDYIPLQLHIECVDGDALRIRCIRVPSDSEHISCVKTFPSRHLTEALEDFVLQTVTQAEVRTAPPFLVGVGLGGTLSEAGFLAEKALMRPIGKPPSSLRSARIEQELLQKINELGIGPGGLGGETTALAFHFASAPSMPDAIPIAIRIVGSTPCISEVLF